MTQEEMQEIMAEEIEKMDLIIHKIRKHIEVMERCQNFS